MMRVLRQLKNPRVNIRLRDLQETNPPRHNEVEKWFVNIPCTAEAAWGV